MLCGWSNKTDSFVEAARLMKWYSKSCQDFSCRNCVKFIFGMYKIYGWTNFGRECSVLYELVIELTRNNSSDVIFIYNF